MQKARPKVGIVYQYFAHYRGPIIDVLTKSNEFDFYFIGDDKVRSSVNLKLHTFTNELFLRVENRWFFKVFLWQNGLLQLLDTTKFDAVIFLGDWKYISTWPALAKLRMRNIPTLFWSHGMLHPSKSFNTRIKMFFLGLFSHGGFVYSSGARKNMIKYGFKRSIEVIYNSLDFQKQNNILKAVNYGDLVADSHLLKPYLILTGRLDARKRVELLFDAVKILKNSNEQIRIVLVGDGEHRPALEEYAAILGIKNEVVFYGSCYDEAKLAELYLNSLVCVIPNAVGLSAIHALTYMTPVITSDNLRSHGPEVEAIVHDRTGRYFKDGDAESLANNILYFKTLTKDKLDDYRSECFRTIEHKYNPGVQYSIMKRLLNEVLKS